MSSLQKFTDYGSALNENATGTHHLTMYRAKSGALVFGAGTVQWSWGLENVNAWGESSTDPELYPPSLAMEQFTVNLLAEMGVQPSSLEAGLIAGTQSTDTTPPSSTITSPRANETLAEGKSTTITGTATDSGGGVVAGVEVSTDNGATWHPATLTTADEQTVSWTYTWSPNHWPGTTIKSRAVDDSNNMETPSAGVSVKVGCPCSIWGTVAPTTPVSSDPNSITVGVKFTAEVGGTVTGVRFYKATTDTGTHVGSLWSASGTLLASATFSNETSSGWQQVNFSKPVSISAGATYVAAYLAPSGHYEQSPDYFYTPTGEGGQILNSPPLHAVSASSEPVGGAFGSANGVFNYGSQQRVPHHQRRRGQLLGGRRVRTGIARRPRSGDESVRDGRERIGDRQLDRSLDRWHADAVHDHPLRRQNGPDDDHRHRPGDQRDGQWVDPGDELHVHRHGVQPDGLRTGLGSVQRRHADERDGAGGADRSGRPGRKRVGVGQLERAVQRRQSDRQVHGHAVHRHGRPDRDERVRDAPGHQRHGQRPHQRDQLHVQGQRDQRNRSGAPVRRLERRDA